MKTFIQLTRLAPALKGEYLLIILSLVLFLIFPALSRHIDITSAPIDPGALSAIIMAVLALLIFKSVTWWVLKAVWPILPLYSEVQFEGDFISLTASQKVKIYLGFYLLLLFSFVLTLHALI